MAKVLGIILALGYTHTDVCHKSILEPSARL